MGFHVYDTETKEFNEILEDYGFNQRFMDSVGGTRFYYDKDGNFIAPGSVPGMDATGIPLSERHKIISVSEESRQDVF